MYTFASRRKLNEAFRKMFPDRETEEMKDGVPMMTINGLPPGACLPGSISEVEEAISPNAFAWKSVVPVFIRINTAPGTGQRFLVNYVNSSETSLMQAGKYISQDRLYWVEGCGMRVE